jgi:phage gpG-like protein
MRTFASPLAFATFLTEVAIIEHAANQALEKAGQIVETEAKRVLGTHDYNWPPLQPETIARKATGDSPLLETGELRDSIHHNVDHSSVGRGRSAFIGSDDDKAVWHEYGTVRIPPRPFLSSALIHKEKEVVEAIGQQIHAHILSRPRP